MHLFALQSLQVRGQSGAALKGGLFGFGLQFPAESDSACASGIGALVKTALGGGGSGIANIFGGGLT